VALPQFLVGNLVIVNQALLLLFPLARGRGLNLRVCRLRPIELAAKCKRPLNAPQLQQTWRRFPVLPRHVLVPDPLEFSPFYLLALAKVAHLFIGRSVEFVEASLPFLLKRPVTIEQRALVALLNRVASFQLVADRATQICRPLRIVVSHSRTLLMRIFPQRAEERFQSDHIDGREVLVFVELFAQ
jgi:hypothetical protein